MKGVMMFMATAVVLTPALILAAGCSPKAPPTFPPQSLRSANTSLDLSMVRQDAGAYRGKTILLEG